MEPATVSLRPALPEDVTEIGRVHRASIRGLCGAAYTPEQVEAWTACLTPEGYARGMRRFAFLLAEAEGGGGGGGGEDAGGGKLLGFCIVNPPEAEVLALYVAPEAVGRGAGSALLRRAEEMIAAGGSGTARLNSTLNAAEFYARRGYRRGEMAEHALPGGVALPAVAMEKSLTGGGGASGGEM